MRMADRFRLFQSPDSSRSGVNSDSPFGTHQHCCSHAHLTPSKQVFLYKWYLIKVVKDHPENCTTDYGLQVSLGGYVTSDILNHEKYITTPIKSRIEKCQLRTVDGLDIRLMGAIDEQCTYANGFPFQVIHLFLTGFPFNWNHVIKMRFGQPSLNTNVRPANKEEEYAFQEKEDTPNLEFLGIQMNDVGTGKSSVLGPAEKMSKGEENRSKVTSRESSIRCSKRGRHELQPIRDSRVVSNETIGLGKDGKGELEANISEIGDSCPEAIGGREEGSLETQKTNTEKTPKMRIKHPPLPPRRVQTTPEEVSKAFGLKTSRSGRLLVPPLAHWCNQTIAYDLDGGIIAILDGSSEGDGDNGSFNFKPPEQKDASRIRKKLCNAATESIWTPKSAKKACKD